MKRQRQALRSAAAGAMRDFLNHHRALGKRFDTEEWALGLFDRYLLEQKIQVLAAITPLMVESFLSSRPRNGAKSYNELLGVLRRWFNWLVVQEQYIVWPWPCAYLVQLTSRRSDLSLRSPSTASKRPNSGSGRGDAWSSRMSRSFPDATSRIPTA